MREAGSAPAHTWTALAHRCPQHRDTHQFCQLFHISDGFKLPGQGGQGHLLLLLQVPGPVWNNRGWWELLWVFEVSPLTGSQQTEVMPP